MQFSLFSISLILALVIHVQADCSQEDKDKMQKCFQQGSGMENLKKGDDKQKCAIVNQFSLCFQEIPDCETEIEGFVRSMSSAFPDGGKEPILCIQNFLDDPMTPQETEQPGSGSAMNSAVLITVLLFFIGNVMAF